MDIQEIKSRWDRAQIDCRELRVGSLRCIKLDRGMVRVERTSPDDESIACILLPEILSGICELSMGDRRRLLKWFGIDVGYTPFRFSDRLRKATTVPGKHTGWPARIAKRLSTTEMSVSRWIRGLTLPTEHQAIQVAEILGWDREETLADLKFEAGERAVLRRRIRERNLLDTAGMIE